MNRLLQLFLAILFLGGLNISVSFAQDGECCDDFDESLQAEIDALNMQKAALLASLKEFDDLKKQSEDLDKKLADAEKSFYGFIGLDYCGLSDFRKKFDETEKKINNKTGNCEDARKMYFDEIESSKAKCLPEFYARYTSMKTKINEWCMKVGDVVVLEGINFETDSYKITKKSMPFMEKALVYMKKYPDQHFEISGHTDSRGTASHNKKLSLNRANSVKSWLVKNGIDANRLTTVGFGPDKPLVPNTSNANMYKNRRIEYKRTK